MAKLKGFDKTVRKMCGARLSDMPAEDDVTVETAIAQAVINKALSGATDAVKLVREIIDSREDDSPKSFNVDIRVVD